MKKALLFLFLALSVACTRKMGFGQWTLQSSKGGSLYKVTVPCTVAGALLDAGETIEEAMFDTSWVFRTSFSIPDSEYCVLRFGSLNYSADVYVNGTCVASADTTLGTFIVREFDVSSLVNRKNTLEVRVHKAPSQALNHGWVDWNKRPEDESMGITGPVELITTPAIQIQDVFVKPIVDPEDLSRARVSIAATLVNRSSSAVEGTLEYLYEDETVRQDVSMGPNDTVTVVSEEQIENPRIWWSREMGSPELYHLTASFKAQGITHGSKKVRFGLRSITAEIDAYGHKLYKLNGRDILLKGAGWTDDRHMRDSHESISRQMAYVADMGLNCIRFENIWGKDDYVYDLCDSLGILALVGWSCQWEWPNYCGYPSVPRYGCINTAQTEDLAVRYFHDQVIRLRNHPAIIGWLTGSDMIPNPGLEKRYLELYDKLDYRPYQCSASGLTSSLSGPSGAKMLGPYEYVGPDYWYIDTTHGGNYGFNTETSTGMNIPQIESLKRMLGEEELWPVSNAWRKICTNGAAVFNSPEPALNAVNGHFSEQEDLEHFVKRYHALDYDATRAMFEAFRCAVPRTTGIIQWMLNSACPSVYWQLYDWYLVPTAAYYGVKKACKPYQLIYNYKEKAVYGVNDASGDVSLTARLRVYNVNSHLIYQREAPVTLFQRVPVKVFDAVEGPAFVDLRLIGPDGEVASNFYCLPQGEMVYDWEHSQWWGLPIKDYPSYEFLNNLPAIALSKEITATEKGWKVSLSNPSSNIAYQTVLKLLDKEGCLVPGVIWTDNFISILPGESVTVECILPEGLKPSSSLYPTVQSW